MLCGDELVGRLVEVAHARAWSFRSGSIAASSSGSSRSLRISGAASARDAGDLVGGGGQHGRRQRGDHQGQPGAEHGQTGQNVASPHDVGADGEQPQRAGGHHHRAERHRDPGADALAQCTAASSEEQMQTLMGSVDRLLLDTNAPSSMLYLEVEDVRAHIEELRDRIEVVSEPHQIFSHKDDALGPAGTSEWQAFVTYSEGNTVGLVSFDQLESCSSNVPGREVRRCLISTLSTGDLQAYFANKPRVWSPRATTQSSCT